MHVTSQSLLERVTNESDGKSWQRMVDVYRPLIIRWLRRCSAPTQDMDDLVQEVLAVVIKELPSFSHSGRTGAFRCWLRTIVANRMRSFWRAGRCRPTVSGDSTFVQALEQIEDPNSDLSKQWEEQHDDYVLGRLLDLINNEFQPTTIQAFRRVALDGADANHVAEELGLTVPAVYMAKSRVLRRLRQEAEGLID